MTNHITELMDTLRSKNEYAEIKHNPASSLMHTVHVTIPTNLFNEMKTMSAVYGVESNDLAGELLTIALKDAINALPEDEHERLREIRESYEKQQIQQSMARAQYNAGGT